MNCIRCAKETENNNIFCNECLKDMERHPVKPGTPVQLPNRQIRTPAKRTSFRGAESKWKNRVFRLKYIIFWLIFLIVVLGGYLAVCLCAIYGVLPSWIAEIFGLAELQPI